MGLAGQMVIATARREDAAVLVGAGLRLSGIALAEVTRNMALHLLRRGVGPGARVALRSDDLVVSLASMLAVGLLGGCWTVAGTQAAELVLDTAPDGQLLPGAVLVDDTWALQPMAEAEAMFPGVPEGEAWLNLGGRRFSDADLLLRFRAEAAVFDRPGVAVAGLGRADEPEQLMLALSTLHHGGVLVESAEPAVWRAEAVMLVAGRQWAIADCLRGWTGGRFRELQLWGKAGDRDAPPLSSFEQVSEGPGFPEAEPAGKPAMFDLLDRLLVEIAGVADAMTFLLPKPGKPDRLTAFLTLEPGADLPRVASEARIAALRLGGQEMVPKRFLVAENLPRHADGSADRVACRDRVLQARIRRHRSRAPQAKTVETGD